MKIFHNGIIVTLENEKDVQEAICIENGIIKYVGSNEEVLKLKSENTELIDLEGKTLLPGFIDPHSHFGVQSIVAQFKALYPAPIGDVNSIDKMISVLKEAVLTHKDTNKFLIAVGYDHEQLIEKRHPTRDDLDKVSKDIPIVVAHSSLHVGTFNSKAIEMLGIDEQAPDPEGGIYGRYEGTNNINGYAEELAFQMHLIPALEEPSQLPDIVKAGQNMYAKAGITTVQDGFTNNNEFSLFKYGVENKLLDLDVHCYPPAIKQIQKGNHWIDGQFVIKYGESIGDNVHFAGFKIVLDGSPQARTAWLSEPYEVVNEQDDPKYVAYPVFEDDEILIEGLLYAVDKNAPVLVHCNGDRAGDQFISCFKEALKRSTTKYTARAVMIHCQTIREDQIDEMAKLNIIPAMYPIHTYFWGDTHIKNLGRQRANKISNQKYALSKGLLPTSHEDCPVLPPNTLLSVWAACNRVTRSGEILGEELRLSRFEALRTVTYNAAYQYNKEDLLGTLKVGKIADLVILDTNVLNCSNDELFETKVLETLKKGKTIFKSDL